MALTQDLESIRLLSVTGKPHTLERISHETKTCAREFARAGNMATHIEKSDRQQRSVLLETSDHALLALGDEHEALGSDFGNGCDAAAGNVFAGDGFETSICLWLAGFGDDGYDVVDVDAATDGEVFAL
ncbi:hypothetical protein NXS19_008416 [Fusarium pseudograminearum]|nr:hypothetical protein NXS19_008416 [Fusarium pseudograminearum]